MAQCIHFSPLGSKDAAQISRLQTALFAPELTEPESEIRQILLNTEKHLVCNLSFGVFADGRMVGYVFAYVETKSLLRGRDEEVIYIKEIALQPGYESALRPVFQRLLAQRFAYAPDLPMEAHAQPEALATWRRLKRYFASLDITVSSAEEPPRAGRPNYHLLRLDFAKSSRQIHEHATTAPTERWQFRDNLSIGVAKEARQWLALKPTWNDLLRDNADSNVFQSFEYLWTWWKQFGIWCDLHVVVVYRQGGAIGAIPLMVEYLPTSRGVSRRMQLMGSPFETGQQVLTFGADADACIEALLAYLDAHRQSWDTLQLDALPHIRIARVRRHFAGSRYRVACARLTRPQIALRSRWSEFLSAYPAALKHQLIAARQRVANVGQPVIRKFSSWPALDDALKTYADIEDRDLRVHWSTRVSNDKSRHFLYADLAQAFAVQGRCQVRILECDGKAIAGSIGILWNNEFQSLRSCIDSTYEQWWPGMALLSFELEDLISQGISVYSCIERAGSSAAQWAPSRSSLAGVQVWQRKSGWGPQFAAAMVAQRLTTALKRSRRLSRLHSFFGRFKNNPFSGYLLRL